MIPEFRDTLLVPKITKCVDLLYLFVLVQKLFFGETKNKICIVLFILWHEILQVWWICCTAYWPSFDLAKLNRSSFYHATVVLQSVFEWVPFSHPHQLSVFTFHWNWWFWQPHTVAFLIQFLSNFQILNLDFTIHPTPRLAMYEKSESVWFIYFLLELMILHTGRFDQNCYHCFNIQKIQQKSKISIHQIYWLIFLIFTSIFECFQHPVTSGVDEK